MQARCPHCTNVFTTDRTGVQFCPTCGRQIHVPEPRAAGTPPEPPQPPPAGIPPPPGAGQPPAGAPVWPSVAATPPVEQLAPAPTEWERRHEVGFFAGYYRTMKRELFSPDPFWRSVRPDGSLWDALAFGWITTVIYLVLASPLTWLQFQWQTRSALQGSPMDPSMREFFHLFGEPLFFFGFMGASLVLYPLGFIVSAAIFHVACLIFGAGKGGFTATARAMGYATAPMIVGWVPCLGGIVASVYGLVLQIWGLTRIHRTNAWRPIMAYVTLFLVGFCCLCGLMFAIIGAAGGFK